MFHAKDNWWFKRLDDGSVRIMQIINKENLVDITFDANTWASIISSVSAEGEHDGRFYKALEFHNKLDTEDKILVRTDIWKLLDEIKAYVAAHPGTISPGDLPMQLMIGFIHDDGTHWAIKMHDVKGIYLNDKEKICQFLSSKL
jgi:hypothetical protein